MGYQYEISPEMQVYLKKKRRAEKAVKIGWIIFGLIAVFAILLNIFGDIYRSQKPFDGSYMQWRETWWSDAIEYCGYDTYHDKLAIKFYSSDNVYIYSDVKYKVAKELLESDSIGSYYNKNIKGKYKSEKLPDYQTLMDKSIFGIID